MRADLATFSGDPLDRMADKFTVGHKSGCWIWHAAMGGTKGYQYPSMAWNKTRINPAKVMYERVKGPIPTGLELDHLCRNPRCINPRHLEPVTPRENKLRRWRYERAVIRLDYDIARWWSN